jgi:hypothetical protein
MALVLVATFLAGFVSATVVGVALEVFGGWL